MDFGEAFRQWLSEPEPERYRNLGRFIPPTWPLPPRGVFFHRDLGEACR